MAGVGVVNLDEKRSGLAHHVAFRGNHLRVAFPVVGVAGAAGTGDSLPEPTERCSITAAHNPGDTLPLATIKGLPDPKLAFF